MASWIARKEACPVVPGTPTTVEELLRKLRESATSLRVQHHLWGWRSALREIPRIDGTAIAVQWLLTLDTGEKPTLRIKGYVSRSLQDAAKAYADEERQHQHNPNVQVVLVSVDDMNHLRRAYPNYYLDTEAFQLLLAEVIDTV
jgi:hypothetical protein